MTNWLFGLLAKLPLVAVLRERLALADDKYKRVEEIAALKRDNELEGKGKKIKLRVTLKPTTSVPASSLSEDVVRALDAATLKRENEIPASGLSEDVVRALDTARSVSST
jgi:hypothetical protein